MTWAWIGLVMAAVTVVLTGAGLERLLSAKRQWLAEPVWPDLPPYGEEWRDCEFAAENPALEEAALSPADDDRDSSPDPVNHPKGEPRPTDDLPVT